MKLIIFVSVFLFFSKFLHISVVSFSSATEEKLVKTGTEVSVGWKWVQIPCKLSGFTNLLSDSVSLPIRCGHYHLHNGVVEKANDIMSIKHLAQCLPDL